MQLTVAEIADTIGAPRPQAVGLARGYSIDSRTLRSGEVFFAIRGENRDGHDFVLGALGAGALAAVVTEDAFERYAPHFRTRLMPVPDTLQALQQLAAFVRRRWAKKVVGVTGSSGKTTTKDMVARVLATRFHVLKTEGNLNNHFGLPLSLLRLTPAHDVAVIEMGMNHAGEIARLAEIAAPQIGIVTNVGAVHLGYFKSIDEIAAAKHELVEALPANGVAILNADDLRVARFSERFAGRVVFFGNLPARPAETVAPGAYVSDVRLLAAEGSEFCAVALGSHHMENAGRALPVKVRLPLLGGHNVLNAAAALAAGMVFGVDLRRAADALAGMRPASSRGVIRRVGGFTVIDDSYNSNPAALENMLRVLMGMPGNRHVVVAGEMLELGDATPELHCRAGEAIARSGADALFAVRGAARYMLEAARAAGFKGHGEFYESAEQCGPALREFLRPGDVVLAKASRGVALERALAAVFGSEPVGTH